MKILLPKSAVKVIKSIPMELIMVSAEAAAPSCPFAQYSANIIQIVLFFFLQSCKYTMTNSHQRMVKLRSKDMQFHDKEGVTPPNAPPPSYFSRIGQSTSS